MYATTTIGSVFTAFFVAHMIMAHLTTDMAFNKVQKIF